MRLLSFILFALFTSTISLAEERILFLGDSHVPGPFGKTLDTRMRNRSDTLVETAGVCGAAAYYFTKGTSTQCGYFRKTQDGDATDTLFGVAPRVQDLIPEFRPTLTLIELGANYHGWSNEGMIEDMSTLAQYVLASGSRCVWITMPDSRAIRDRQGEIVANTIQAVSPYCTVIDSTELTEYPDFGGDGVHYEFKAGRPIAEHWAEQVYKRVFESKILK